MRRGYVHHLCRILGKLPRLWIPDCSEFRAGPSGRFKSRRYLESIMVVFGAFIVPLVLCVSLFSVKLVVGYPNNAADGLTARLSDLV